MTLFALLLACGSGKVVLDPTGTPDDDGAVDDTGPSGDEGGSSGGDSGGDSGGSSGGDSGGSSGGSGGGEGGGSSSGGGETGEPPGPDYAGSYAGTISMEVADWGWSCQSDLTLEVDEDGGFDQDAVCTYESDWGDYDTPASLRGTTDADGAVSGLASIEIYGYGNLEAEITGELGDGLLRLEWETEIDSWGGGSSTGTGAFKGMRE